MSTAGVPRHTKVSCCTLTWTGIFSGWGAVARLYEDLLAIGLDHMDILADLLECHLKVEWWVTVMYRKGTMVFSGRTLLYIYVSGCRGKQESESVWE